MVDPSRNLQCLMSYHPCLADSLLIAFPTFPYWPTKHMTRCCRDWPRNSEINSPRRAGFEYIWTVNNKKLSSRLGVLQCDGYAKIDIFIELIHPMISDDAIWQIFPGVLLNKLPTRCTSTNQNNWRHARLGCSSTVTSVNQKRLGGNSPFSWITFQLKTSMRIHL